ncbi:LysR family transcriptional regulator, partial [Bacillus cereus]
VINGDIVPVDLINHRTVNISLGMVQSENKHLSTFANQYIHHLKSKIIKS